MVKAKFGASVRAKTPVAQVDEVLVKILCHNIVVLIQSMFELGIMPALFGQGLFLQSRPLSNRGEADAISVSRKLTFAYCPTTARLLRLRQLSA